MRIVVAPDKFKGSLPATEVACPQGWDSARPAR
jgi:glycerate kinase